MGCREGAAAGLVTNFESDLPSAFYAYLYRHSGLPGGHVVMLGDDQASRQAPQQPLCYAPLSLCSAPFCYQIKSNVCYLLTLSRTLKACC